MSRYLARRTLMLVLTLVVTSLLVFAALDALPGNAAQVLMGPDADPAAVAAKAHALGLDRPALLRYAAWIAGLLHGDMGASYAYGAPVARMLAERLTLTIPLALLAMALAVVIALVVGVYAAARHRRAGDVGVMLLAQAGIAIPNFWLAMLLILLFSVKLGWLSSGGFDGWDFGDGLWPGLWDGIKALILPALALAAVQGAILARFTRSAMLEALREDFVRTARAKGLSPCRVLWRHTLRNALIPVVTVMGMQFAELLTGAIVVENVFYLPGLGRLIFQSIANRDVIVVQNAVLLLACLIVLVNFGIDVLYAVIDPRVQTRRRRGALRGGRHA